MADEKKDMTSDGYGLLLRIEYGFWQQARREYDLGRISREKAVLKMDLQRKHILGWKQRCQEELDPDTYPEEYYQDIPEPAENVLPAKENPPEKLIAVNETELPQGDGTQMNILDYIRDGKICWR